MEKAAAKEQIRIHDEQNEKTRADSPLINSVVGPRSLCESEERFLLTERLKDDLQRARKQQIALQTELLERDSTLLELRFDLETKVEEVARWQRRADELQNAYSSTTSLLEQAASKAPVSPTNAAITTMSAVLSVSNSRNRTKREGELEGVIEAMKRVLGRLRNDNDRLRRGGFTHDEDQHNSTPDYEKKAIIEKKRADKLESQLRDMTTKLQDAEDSNRKLLQRQNQVATLRTQLRAKDEETKRIHEEWVLIKEDRDRLRGQLQGLENRISEVNAGSLSNTTNDNPRRHLPTTPSGDRQNKSQFTQQQSKETDQRDQLIALQEENDELTALLREATDTLAMQQAQLKLVAKSTTSVESAQSIPASSLIPQEDILRLQDENKRLRSELSAFDLQFFEEIENLKYSYSEAMKKIKIYEKLYGQK